MKTIRLLILAIALIGSAGVINSSNQTSLDSTVSYECISETFVAEAQAGNCQDLGNTVFNAAIAQGHSLGEASDMATAVMLVCEMLNRM